MSNQQNSYFNDNEDDDIFDEYAQNYTNDLDSLNNDITDNTTTTNTIDNTITIDTNDEKLKSTILQYDNYILNTVSYYNYYWYQQQSEIDKLKNELEYYKNRPTEINVHSNISVYPTYGTVLDHIPSYRSDNSFRNRPFITEYHDRNLKDLKDVTVKKYISLLLRQKEIRSKIERKIAKYFKRNSDPYDRANYVRLLISEIENPIHPIDSVKNYIKNNGTVTKRIINYGAPYDNKFHKTYIKEEPDTDEGSDEEFDEYTPNENNTLQVENKNSISNLHKKFLERELTNDEKNKLNERAKKEYFKRQNRLNIKKEPVEDDPSYSTNNINNSKKKKGLRKSNYHLIDEITDHDDDNNNRLSIEDFENYVNSFEENLNSTKKLILPKVEKYYDDDYNDDTSEDDYNNIEKILVPATPEYSSENELNNTYIDSQAELNKLFNSQVNENGNDNTINNSNDNNENEDNDENLYEDSDTESESNSSEILDEIINQTEIAISQNNDTNIRNSSSSSNDNSPFYSPPGNQEGHRDFINYPYSSYSDDSPTIEDQILLITSSQGSNNNNFNLKPKKTIRKYKSQQ